MKPESEIVRYQEKKDTAITTEPRVGPIEATLGSHATLRYICCEPKDLIVAIHSCDPAQVLDLAVSFARKLRFNQETASLLTSGGNICERRQGSVIELCQDGGLPVKNKSDRLREAV